MTEQILMAVSVSIIGLLGLAHFVLTFWGTKLAPRDKSLEQAMSSIAPVITTQTNIWRMWVGFNASHSMGAMLFGLVYGYLALFQSETLFQSIFLQWVGFGMIAGFAILARLYWFSKPFAGSILSLLLYISSIALA